VSPNATRAEVVGKIIYLRQSYHFGPHKIAMYLKRYHDIQISPSGIWRILRRLDMSRLPASQRYRRHVDRWKRYEKPLPELFNDRLQEWESFYNFNRPHGGLGGQTPYERLRQKTRARS
jgi:transposase InsO family protein